MPLEALDLEAVHGGLSSGGNKKNRGGNRMTIYLVQGRYTQQAITGMIAKPEDRAGPVGALVEAAGGKLLDLYITFGDHDFLAVVESKKSETDTMGAVMAAAASGTITGVRTTVAVRSKDAMKAMRVAKRIQKGFKPAGQ
jgi:uncharacterized protein with GYD domain